MNLCRVCDERLSDPRARFCDPCQDSYDKWLGRALVRARQVVVRKEQKMKQDARRFNEAIQSMRAEIAQRLQDERNGIDRTAPIENGIEARMVTTENLYWRVLDLQESVARLWEELESKKWWQFWR